MVVWDHGYGGDDGWGCEGKGGHGEVVKVEAYQTYEKKLF